MDCIVIAGGVPTPEDPLYAYTQGKTKAQLDMNGRTMLERVVDAIQDSTYIEDVVIVGLGDNMGMTFKRPVYHLPDQGSLVGNALAGANWLRKRKPGTRHVLVASSDVPTLTGAIVDQFINTCQPLDKGLYYILVTKETMEARFPLSNRTFVKLKGLQVAGGDLTIVEANLADGREELWAAFTEARKHAWKLARLVGLRFLLKFLLHRVSLTDLEEVTERILNRPAKVILSPQAEIAMDADKPRQVDLLRADLGRAYP